MTKAVQWWAWWEEIGQRKTQENFRGKGHIHYHDCSHGFTGIYICQYLPNYIL